MEVYTIYYPVYLNRNKNCLEGNKFLGGKKKSLKKTPTTSQWNGTHNPNVCMQVVNLLLLRCSKA